MTILTSALIIATRNRLNDIHQALTSVAQQTRMPQEIIIVDSSDQPVCEHTKFKEIFLPHIFPSVRLVYQHTTPGLPYQRNVGISLAQADLIHFIDDDVVLEPDYIEQMARTFEEHPTFVGGMGTVTNLPPKKHELLRQIRRLFFLQRNYAAGTFTWSGMPTHAYGTYAFKEVEVLGGCCMSYRRSLCEILQFDESLGRYAWMEDCDFSWRASRVGSLFFNPHARLQHFNSPTARDAQQAVSALFMKNYTYLFFKNFYPCNRLRVLAYCWSIIGLFLEALLIRDRQYVYGYAQGLRQYLAR